MHVKILGPMTKQAELLLQNTAIALKKLKVKAEFEKFPNSKGSGLWSDGLPRFSHRRKISCCRQHAFGR